MSGMDFPKRRIVRHPILKCAVFLCGNGLWLQRVGPVLIFQPAFCLIDAMACRGDGPDTSRLSEPLQGIARTRWVRDWLKNQNPGV